MTNLRRGVSTAFARKLIGFDVLSDPTRMDPTPDMANDLFTDLNPATQQICKILPANNAANDATVQYGLGVVAGAPRIYIKNSPITTWLELSATPAQGDGTRQENLFVEYQGRIYFAHNTGIQSYSISANTYDTGMAGTLSVTLSQSDIFQGLVHSKDDVLYIPYTTISSGVTSAFIASKNGSGAFNITALTLPKNVVPISICEYGNYLAIACRPKQVQSQKSVVYLWDRDSSLSTLSEKIDFGLERLEFIEELGGGIVGVSSYANTSSEVITVKPKLIFRYYNGGLAEQFLELPITSSIINNSSNLAWDNQKLNNRIFFTASVELQGTRTDAIWAIAKKADGSLTVSIDRYLNNGTAITSCVPRGFYKFGDYFTASYTDNGTYVTKTTINGAATYTASALFETVIMGESYLKFKLNSVGVMFEKLPADGQVVLKYRKDGDTSWTTIFTYTTDDALFHEAVNIESTAANLPEFLEIEFQITSIGGAVITGFWAQAEEVPAGLVNRILKVISGWIG